MRFRLSHISSDTLVIAPSYGDDISIITVDEIIANFSVFDLSTLEYIVFWHTAMSKSTAQNFSLALCSLPKVLITKNEPTLCSPQSLFDTKRHISTLRNFEILRNRYASDIVFNFELTETELRYFYEDLTGIDIAIALKENYKGSSMTGSLRTLLADMQCNYAWTKIDDVLACVSYPFNTGLSQAVCLSICLSLSDDFEQTAFSISDLVKEALEGLSTCANVYTIMLESILNHIMYGALTKEEVSIIDADILLKYEEANKEL